MLATDYIEGRPNTKFASQQISNHMQPHGFHGQAWQMQSVTMPSSSFGKSPSRHHAAVIYFSQEPAFKGILDAYDIEISKGGDAPDHQYFKLVQPYSYKISNK